MEDYDSLMAVPDRWVDYRAIFDSLQAKEIEEAMNLIPDEQRVVLALREIGELNYEEIGEACQIPVGTVRSRLARARGAMQSLLVDLAREHGILGKEAKDDGTK